MEREAQLQTASFKKHKKQSTAGPATANVDGIFLSPEAAQAAHAAAEAVAAVMSIGQDGGQRGNDSSSQASMISARRLERSQNRLASMGMNVMVEQETDEVENIMSKNGDTMELVRGAIRHNAAARAIAHDEAQRKAAEDIERKKRRAERKSEKKTGKMHIFIAALIEQCKAIDPDHSEELDNIFQQYEDQMLDKKTVREQIRNVIGQQNLREALSIFFDPSMADA